MDVQLASDLHLEFCSGDWPDKRLIVPTPVADVLVLAGDITNGGEAFKLLARRPGIQRRNIIYDASNYAFYGCGLEPLRTENRETAAQISIYFFDNERIDNLAVLLLGKTLWANYRLPTAQLHSYQTAHAERSFKGHRLIRFGRSRFTAQVTLTQHVRSVGWLQAELYRPYAGKTVVVTHHIHHPLSAHPSYVGEELNAAFVSDLSALLPPPDFWRCGHVHVSLGYCYRRCRAAANPVDDSHNRGVAMTTAQFHFKNANFSNHLVVKLASLTKKEALQ